MVHALREIWRVLVLNGVMIDLRPFADNWPLAVVDGERVYEAGLFDASPGSVVDTAANGAISQVLREGLFSCEYAELFTQALYWDTMTELEEYLEAHWATEVLLPALLKEKALHLLNNVGAEGKLRLNLSMTIARYHKK